MGSLFTLPVLEIDNQSSEELVVEESYIFDPMHKRSFVSPNTRQEFSISHPVTPTTDPVDLCFRETNCLGIHAGMLMHIRNHIDHREETLYGFGLEFKMMRSGNNIKVVVVEIVGG